MDVESFSGAATIALASTVVFVLVSKSWHIVLRSVTGEPRFADSIMREAAQRFREEFERLSQRQSTYLSAGLVFIVLFAAAYVLNAERIFSGYPAWQLYIFIIALVAGMALAAQRLIRTILARRRICLLRDANIAVGHQLQSIASEFGRVYHEVETSAGVIDHVVVGSSGAYAVNVFAEPPKQGGIVEINDNTLHFRPHGKPVSLVRTAALINALEREFRRLLDHRVRVRSVIAAPGWQVNGEPGDDHILVNDKSLDLLRGRKDRSDHLVNDDVDALHRFLTTRCRLKEGKAEIPADPSR